MRRSRSALLRARSVLLAGLLTLGPSTLIALPAAAGTGGLRADRAVPVDGRGSRTVDRSVRLHGSAAETRASNRPARHVVAKDLPRRSGSEATYTPTLRGPKGLAASGGATRSPSS